MKKRNFSGMTISNGCRFYSWDSNSHFQEKWVQPLSADKKSTH